MVLAIKEFEDIVNDIVRRLLTKNDELTDLNESSIIRMLIETYALELSSTEFSGIYQQIVEVYNATRLSIATGLDLEEIGSIVGITRDIGNKASLEATFIRNTVSAVDFDIIINTVIATIPDDDNILTKFITNQTTTFKATIANETHNFVDGIYKYRLNQRLFDSITTLDALVSSTPTTLILDTDYSIVENFNDILIDTNTVVDIDRCESTTDWISSIDATSIAIDGTTKIEGVNSLKLGKDGISTALFSYNKTYGATVNVSGLNPILNLYIKDQTTLDKLKSITTNFGSSVTDYIINEIDISTLIVGWNEIKLTTNLSSSTGSPLLDSILYFNIDFETNNISDTLAAGDINIDFFYFAITNEYRGTIVEFLDTTKPDNNTDIIVTYRPLSLEVQTTSELIGTSYNVGPDKVTNKVTELPQITTINNYESGFGGEDIETDSELRLRIQNATTGLGKATVTAIKSAIEELDHVTTASVIDMPTLNAQESFTYDTLEDTYQLDKEVAQDDSYLRVTIDRTTLSSGIDDSVTTIPVTSITNLPAGVGDNFKYVIIGTEIIKYETISGNDLLTATRGALGTTAASHLSSDDVKFLLSPDIDFVISQLSEIVIKPLAETNDHIFDTDIVDVDYQYRWLSHFLVFATGPFTFTTLQNAAVVTVIEDTKAAGINYVYTVPTLISINIIADIKIEVGFSFTAVRANVIEALNTHLNSYDIGEDVFLSQIINAIMDVEGVDYTNLTTPATTTVINATEIAKQGTIVINEL